MLVGGNELSVLHRELVDKQKLALSVQSTYDGDDFESVFNLTFEITRQRFDQTINVELIPDGSKIPVTKDNCKQYVNAYIDVTWLVLSLRSDLKVSFAEVLLYCCSRDVAYLHGILLCRLVWLNRSETLWWYLPSRLVRDFLRGYLRLL
jgi:hypothetical protein